MSNPELQVLDRTVIFYPQITLWSGRSRLTKEDLGSDADKLPPEDLASLGSVKLCDPEQLTKLNSVKRALERDLLKLSVRFLGGFATSQDRLAEGLRILHEKEQEFLDLRTAFLASMNRDVEKWIGDHRQWEHVLRRRMPDQAYVGKQISFAHSLFRVVAAAGAGAADSVENIGLTSAVSGLGGQLFHEIEVEASELRKKSIEGQAEVTQRALRPIRAMRQKLETLSYLDARTGPVIELIDATLAKLPKKGKIAGGDLSALMGIVDLLCSAERMQSHGAGIFKGKSASAAAATKVIDAVRPANEAIVTATVEDQAPLVWDDTGAETDDDDDTGDERGDALTMPPAAPVTGTPGTGIWF